MATKERLAAMAASLCAVCSGSMVIKLVEADPSDGASELRTYVCAECGHRRTYSVPAGTPDGKEYRTAGGVRNNAKAIYRIDMVAQGFMGRPK